MVSNHFIEESERTTLEIERILDLDISNEYKSALLHACETQFALARAQVNMEMHKIAEGLRNEKNA